jgi:putative solute:sodium symporter small subunit
MEAEFPLHQRTRPMNESQQTVSYWRSNLKLVIVLLLIWAVTGFGLSVFSIEAMNHFKIGEVGFGFWMAQQGSIFVFVVLVLVYALAMDWIDRKHNVND